MPDAATRGTIIGGGGFFKGREQSWALSILDLDREHPEARLCSIGFLGHGLTVDPRDETRAAVFEKKGPGAAIVDLARVEKLREIPTPENRHFYGHGAYSKDGSLLYATESYLDRDFEGALVVRDSDTLKELGTVPTFGTAPHDCILIDGKVMLVANGGGPLNGGDPACLTWVDIESEKLLERVDVPLPRFNAGHVARNDAGDVALVSAPREGLPAAAPKLGAVSLKLHDGPLCTMTKPKDTVAKMKGETLSVLIDEARDRVLATHPDGHMLTVWSLSKGRIERKLKQLEGPRGVCLSLDGTHYVVSHRIGNVPTVTLLPCDTLEPLTDSAISPSYTSGSHIYTHDLRAAKAARRAAAS